MRPYVIYAPPFHSGSAGIVVMHRLAHEIRQKGLEVYLNTSIQNPKVPPIPICEKIFPEAAIAVYPEIVQGNPFGSNRVVRYILCVPGFWGGPKTYDDTDILFIYSDYWRKESGLNLPDDRVLFIPDLIESEWPNLNLKREYNLWYRGKGKQPEVSEITRTAEFIGHNTQFNGVDMQHWLWARLNKCEIFYSYDVATALVPIAIFCGCKIGLVKDENRNPSLPPDTTEAKLREYYRKSESELCFKMNKFVEITQEG